MIEVATDKVCVGHLTPGAEFVTCITNRLGTVLERPIRSGHSVEVALDSPDGSTTQIKNIAADVVVLKKVLR